MEGHVGRLGEVKPAGHLAYLDIGVVSCGELWVSNVAVGIFILPLHGGTNKVDSIS